MNDLMGIALSRKGIATSNPYKDWHAVFGVKKDIVQEIGDFEWVFLEVDDGHEFLWTSYLAIVDFLTGHWHDVTKEHPPKVLSLSAPYVPVKIYTFDDTQDIIDYAKFTASNPAVRLALESWRSAYNRDNPDDVFIDCCRSLESLFRLDGELRLRISLYASYLFPRQNRTVLSKVYKMYGERSNIAHGRKSTGQISSQECIEVVSNILECVLVKKKVPDSVELDAKIGLQ